MPDSFAPSRLSGPINTGLLLRFFIKRHVDINDLDAGFERLLHRCDHSLGIGRGQNDHIELLRDEVFHRIDLGGKITFIFHADSGKGKLVGILGSVIFSTGLHLLEELVCKRLHDKPDFGFVRCKRR